MPQIVFIPHLGITLRVGDVIDITKNRRFLAYNTPKYCAKNITIAELRVCTTTPQFCNSLCDTGVKIVVGPSRRICLSRSVTDVTFIKGGGITINKVGEI